VLFGADLELFSHLRSNLQVIDAGVVRKKFRLVAARRFLVQGPRCLAARAPSALSSRSRPPMPWPSVMGVILHRICAPEKPTVIKGLVLVRNS
jgi:hypothetical protein